MNRPDILSKIHATKLREVAALEFLHPAAQWRRLAEQARAGHEPPRGLARALRGSDTVAVIAEIKKASPSRGIIRADFDPGRIAAEYEGSAAAAVSVLTDAEYFQGRIEYIPLVRRVCSKPVLRKDFIIHELQLFESVIAGADAVLLIAAMLEPAELGRLHAAALEWGLDPLVEVHDAAELREAAELGARLIGINNRDLRSFEVRFETSLELAPLAPVGACVVAESGVFTREHVEMLAAAGAHAVLVGESIMRDPDPAARIAELAGVSA